MHQQDSTHRLIVLLRPAQVNYLRIAGACSIPLRLYDKGMYPREIYGLLHTSVNGLAKQSAHVSTASERYLQYIDYICRNNMILSLAYDVFYSQAGHTPKHCYYALDTQDNLSILTDLYILPRIYDDIKQCYDLLVKQERLSAQHA
jgi:hypothetical protein